MIVAIEGPDCSGKTTLFKRLFSSGAGRRTCWVPRSETNAETLSCVKSIDRAIEHLWRCLYDRNQQYICDRHFTVSAPVYDELYGRPAADYSVWYPIVRVVYLDQPLSFLESRHMLRGDEHFDITHYRRVMALYEKHVRNFKFMRTDGTDVASVAEQIQNWWRTR